MLPTEASNGPSRNLLRGDAGDLAGLELVEFTLGLLELGLLGVAVELRVEAGDQALGEPGAPWAGAEGPATRSLAPRYPRQNDITAGVPR